MHSLPGYAIPIVPVVRVIPIVIVWIGVPFVPKYGVQASLWNQYYYDILGIMSYWWHQGYSIRKGFACWAIFWENLLIRLTFHNLKPVDLHIWSWHSMLIIPNLSFLFWHSLWWSDLIKPCTLKNTLHIWSLYNSFPMFIWFSITQCCSCRLNLRLI